MNYLAHSFLTFNDGQIVGQFLEDYIRNSERYDFQKDIQDGITLHRKIDTFTDAHPAIFEAKKIFSPVVRLYSGAFVDVALDYFLANDPNYFPDDRLKEHSQKVYEVLEKNTALFPVFAHDRLTHMKNEDWLSHYKSNWGMKMSMQNVLNKAKYLDKNIPVYEVFMSHKEEIKKWYDLFFPELKKYVEEEYKKIKTADKGTD